MIRSFASKLGGQFATESHGQFLRNIQDIKESLIEMINNEDYRITSPDGEVSGDYFADLQHPIRYKQNLRIRDGVISHDEVIELSAYMFHKYPRLVDIVKDRYGFILIDEYQDTDSRVVDMFLKNFSNGRKQNIVGLFGDSMQSIYDNGVGDVKSYIEQGFIHEVQKTQNRRNPEAVIKLGNRLRTDGLVQVPSDDIIAPNMENGKIKHGNVVFVHSKLNDLDYIKAKIGWSFKKGDSAKELNLTHNLIAGKAGFPLLMAIYDGDPVIALKDTLVAKMKSSANNGAPYEIPEDASFEGVLDLVNPTDRFGVARKDLLIAEHPDLYAKVKDMPFLQIKNIYLNKDSLIDDKKESVDDDNRTGSKRDALVKHLVRLYDNVNLYQDGKYNEFIRKTQFSINSVSDKKILKESIVELSEAGNRSINEVIELAHKLNICLKDDHLDNFIANKGYIYDRIGTVPFQEFINLYNYLEGYTPFSTQHKIKGNEFTNVLVVLDNGGWNLYNFEYLFDQTMPGSLSKAKQNSYPRILMRTQKLFYVCCTRAKENLFIFYHDPSVEVLKTANEWFKGNVVEIL